MIRDTADTNETLSADDFDRCVNSRTLIKELIALRTSAGLSQSDVAKKMDCSQSRISKLEHSLDDDLALGDVRQYMAALDLKMLVGGKKNSWSLVDEIKVMAIGIKRKLEELAELAGEDESIASGIASFYAEAFFNFNKMLIDNAGRLPSNPENGKPFITFYLETEEPENGPIDEKACSQLTSDETALA